jgi:hypothetical protein
LRESRRVFDKTDLEDMAEMEEEEAAVAAAVSMRGIKKSVSMQPRQGGA